jgi:branched-subunit amino acid ABC-type transport system permease component
MSEFLAFATLGVIRGMVYGVIALGIVLVYKGSRTLNLAQPFFGLFAVFIAWYLTGWGGIPGAPETAIGGIDTGPWFIRWIRYPLGLFLFDLGSRPRFLIAAIVSLLLIMRIAHRIDHDLMRRLEAEERREGFGPWKGSRGRAR